MNSEDILEDPLDGREEPESQKNAATDSELVDNKESHISSLTGDSGNGWLDILGSGQLKKKVLVAGEEKTRPGRASLVTLKISGRLDNGTQIDKQDMLTFLLGDAEVVQGLDLIVPLMDRGEVAEVYVDARFAYGELGCEPNIPANAAITYTVTLIRHEPEPELESMSTNDRLLVGSRKRDRGNWWFNRQQFTFAIQCYRRAIEFLDESSQNFTDIPDDLHELLEERLKVYNNLAAAQMKIESYETAIQSVDKVLQCQPQNVKALFRKGKILGLQGECESAVSILKKALKLEPESKIIHSELSRLQRQQKKDVQKERNLYKKMLGMDKPAGSLVKSTSKIRWRLMIGSVAALLAGMVAYRYRFF